MTTLQHKIVNMQVVVDAYLSGSPVRAWDHGRGTWAMGTIERFCLESGFQMSSKVRHLLVDIKGHGQIYLCASVT